jgi:hypothetical protein
MHLNEIIVKSAYVNMCQFLIQNCLKLGDGLLPLHFNFALQCANRQVQETQVQFKLNGAHQLLVCADVNLLGDNIDAINKNQTL